MAGLPYFLNSVGVVFCDFLTATVPPDEWLSLRGELMPVLDEVYCESPQDGVYLCPLGGWLKVGKRAGIVWVQASGGLLAALRHKGCYVDYLRAFASRPHRVTRLDAALDVVKDGPDEIGRVYALACSGGIALSQKTIRPKSVSASINPCHFDGRQTGTVYVGSRTAEVRLAVYDKREEYYRDAKLDVGQLVRYELRVTGKMGATLRDAHEPAAMFWHFVSPDVLQAPPEALPWIPFTEGGFTLGRAVSSPYERLRRRVERSAELARLFALADECGPQGRKLLYGLLRRFHDPAATWADVERALLAAAGGGIGGT